MIYTGTSDQRHMAAYLDQLPADQYAAERLDRSLIELAGRVARGCIRGVVTAILAGDEKTTDWDVLRHLTAPEQAEILERRTSSERAAEMRRVEAAKRQRQFLSRRRSGDQSRRAITDAQQSAQARADAGDVPDQEAH
jgi:hypothetical protein